MTEDEKNLILKLVLNQITKNEFLNEMGLDELTMSDYILSSLLESYENKNSDEIELLLSADFSVPVSEKFVNVLCALIVEKWHISHEDIAMILQEIRSPISVDCLFNAVPLASQLEYLNYNDGESFITKCMWALGDIGTNYSKERLKELSNSQNLIVKKEALFQLNKIEP